MVRETSLRAYEEIRDSGILSQRQVQAYEVFYKHGPLTGNELSDKMGIPGQWKLCSIMKKRGVLKEVGLKVCRITGREVIAWDVTDNLPRKEIEITSLMGTIFRSP